MKGRHNGRKDYKEDWKRKARKRKQYRYLMGEEFFVVWERAGRVWKKWHFFALFAHFLPLSTFVPVHCSTCKFIFFPSFFPWKNRSQNFEGASLSFIHLGQSSTALSLAPKPRLYSSLKSQPGAVGICQWPPYVREGDHFLLIAFLLFLLLRSQVLRRTQSSTRRPFRRKASQVGWVCFGEGRVLTKLESSSYNLSVRQLLVSLLTIHLVSPEHCGSLLCFKKFYL